MKKILLILFLLPNVLFAQNSSPPSYDVKMSQVFDVGYVSKALYAHTSDRLLLVSKSGDSIHLRTFNKEDLDFIGLHSYAAFPP